MTERIGVRQIFGLWLPLAISFELMMLEGPTVQGAMGRLPDAKLNLAAWGLTISLSLLIESPIIMLLATAIALVRDNRSYRALRLFMLNLVVACTLLTALIAFTPLYGLVTEQIMRQPSDIARAARPALQIMLLWTAAIGWRRFYQGIMVHFGQTRMVSWGTLIRLTITVALAVGLASSHHLPGVQVGAFCLMAGVISEALATTLFAYPTVRRHLQYQPLPTAQAGESSVEVPLTQKRIWQFHAPLATTTLLTLLAQPMTAAALARLPEQLNTLAVWPAVYMLLLVLRGWGLALQEITVSRGKDPSARPALKRFTWLVGLTTSGVTALIAFTPLLDLYLGQVLHLSPELFGYARLGMGIGVFMPLISSLSSWAGGLLVAMGQTGHRYRGMALNLATHAALLALGVTFQWPGIWVAAGAFTLASIAEYLYLSAQIRG